MNKLKYSVALISLLSIPSFAAMNVVGVGVGYGTQEYELENTSTGGDEFNIDAYYRFMFHPNLGVEFGWSEGVGGIGSFIVDQISEIRDASFSGLNLGAVYEYPLLSWLYFNARASVNRYKVEYTFNRLDRDETRFGFEGLLGLEARTPLGIGFTLGYKYLDNSLVQSNQGVLGINYRF